MDVLAIRRNRIALGVFEIQIRNSFPVAQEVRLKQIIRTNQLEDKTTNLLILLWYLEKNSKFLKLAILFFDDRIYCAELTYRLNIFSRKKFCVTNVK